MFATAPATVRRARSSRGREMIRTTRPPVVDGLSLALQGRLVGHFYIHNGEASGFVCDRA